MAKRKTSKNLRNEWTDKKQKLAGLEARIKERALEMCKQQPSAPIGMGAIGREIEKFTGDTDFYLQVINSIEQYNEQQSGHVQTTMFPKG